MAPWVAAAGAIVTAAGTVLSWPTHASTRRTGFDVASSVAEIGVTFEDRRLRFLAVAWYLIPMSVGAAFVGAALHRRRVWRAISALAVCCVAYWVATMLLARRVGLGLWWSGPSTTAAGSVVVAVASWWASSTAGVSGVRTSTQPSTSTSE